MSAETGNGLRAAAAARTLGATERARRALVELHKRAETITFAAVAVRANVSRQFLYTHPDLRPEIERLPGEPQPPARLPPRERASDESVQTRLRVALDENKRLRDENADLRDELARAYGRVRELEVAQRTTARG